MTHILRKLDDGRLIPADGGAPPKEGDTVELDGKQWLVYHCGTPPCVITLRTGPVGQDQLTTWLAPAN